MRSTIVNPAMYELAQATEGRGYREWRKKQYELLKLRWDIEGPSVIWIGERDTAEFSARMICYAWIIEMLVHEKDPSLMKIMVFTETKYEADLAAKTLHSILSGMGLVFIQNNSESIVLDGGRSVNFAPMSVRTTRGTGADRFIVMIREDALEWVSGAQPGGYVAVARDAYVRLLKDLIIPVMQMTDTKFVVYGVPVYAQKDGGK